MEQDEHRLEPPSFEPSEDDEMYGRFERQVAFKLLAAHAMMDRKFFYQLREDPEVAAAMLHVRLNKQDISYIRDTVNWSELEKHWDSVREAIQPEAVVRSLW
jgi:predicted NAD-dependent protein-ADP-ribosyltransferase YbiA (DUF1768 family)